MKECLNLLLPFLTCLMNKALTNGFFPNLWKNVCVTHVLKRNNLDPCATSSYRPISNFTFLSKLLERLVNKQPLHNLNRHGLFKTNQSAFRANHSTDSALLKISTDVLSAMDRGCITILSLLDLTRSAFN